MDKKQQKKLYIAGGATGILVIALMVLAFLRWQDTTIEQEYQDKVDALQSALRIDPYPNAKNTQALKDKTTALTQAGDAIRDSLTKLPSTLEGDFTNSLRESVTQLNSMQMPMLATPDSTAAATPAEITQEYNFETYLSGGLLPSPEHLDRLLLQYSIVQDVVSHLIKVAPAVGDKKEVLVTKVKRVIFDKKDNTATDQKSSRRSSSRNKKAEEPASSFAGAPVAKELTKEVQRESFEISFRARYGVVAKFLNALNTSETFYVVNSVKILPVMTLEKEVETKTAVKKASTTSRRSTRNKKADEPETPVVEGLANRLVPNPKTASLVDVTISFDVYYVEAAKDESEGK